jgi:hypothetical protein
VTIFPCKLAFLPIKCLLVLCPLLPPLFARFLLFSFILELLLVLFVVFILLSSFLVIVFLSSAHTLARSKHSCLSCCFLVNFFLFSLFCVGIAGSICLKSRMNLIDPSDDNSSPLSLVCCSIIQFQSHPRTNL